MERARILRASLLSAAAPGGGPRQAGDRSREFGVVRDVNVLAQTLLTSPYQTDTSPCRNRSLLNFSH